MCSGCRIIRYCCKVCQKAHWKEHKASCKRMAATYGDLKDRVAPARALMCPPGPQEYPPETRGVLHTVPGVHLDTFHFMKLDSVASASVLGAIGVGTMSRFDCVSLATDKAGPLHELLLLYLMDECPVPGAFLGGVVTAPPEGASCPAEVAPGNHFGLRQMLRVVKRKTQRQMQKLAGENGLALAWKTATLSKDPNRPWTIMAFGCEAPAPKLQENILGMIVGRMPLFLAAKGAGKGKGEPKAKAATAAVVVAACACTVLNCGAFKI